MEEPLNLPPLWVDAKQDDANSIEDADTGLSRVCAYECAECPFMSSEAHQAVYDPEKIRTLLEEATEADSFFVCASSGSAGSEFPPAVCSGYLEARDDSGELWYQRSWRPRYFIGTKRFLLVEPPGPVRPAAN